MFAILARFFHSGYTKRLSRFSEEMAHACLHSGTNLLRDCKTDIKTLVTGVTTTKK